MYNSRERWVLPKANGHMVIWSMPIYLHGVYNQRARQETKSTMEGGAAYFRKQMPYHFNLEGDIDGVKFIVKGEGTGNANTGVVHGKYVCTTGVLPTSWLSLVTTLSYGAKCFTKYPNGIKHFYQSCFPDGYIEDRTLTWENDGVYTVHAEVTLKDGAIYNKTTLKGEGFKKDGFVLGKELKDHLPIVTMVIPNGEGIKLVDQRAYGLKNGGFMLMNTVQNSKSMKVCSADVPKYHYMLVSVELSQDISETKDHIVVHETLTAADPQSLTM